MAKEDTIRNERGKEVEWMKIQRNEEAKTELEEWKEEKEGSEVEYEPEQTKRKERKKSEVQCLEREKKEVKDEGGRAV